MPNLVDIIFLDIDGVLLPFGGTTAAKQSSCTRGCIFPDCTMGVYPTIVSSQMVGEIRFRSRMHSPKSIWYSSTLRHTGARLAEGTHPNLSNSTMMPRNYTSLIPNDCIKLKSSLLVLIMILMSLGSITLQCPGWRCRSIRRHENGY